MQMIRSANAFVLGFKSWDGLLMFVTSLNAEGEELKAIQLQFQHSAICV